ncbi:MAG: Ig-like domain-containing protein [Sedimentisphaerales bacterium]|nr:Ig-like domain-containing protein [Sedimentisphaerales bacterium]
MKTIGMLCTLLLVAWSAEIGYVSIAQGGTPITVVNAGFEDPDYYREINGFDGEVPNPDYPASSDDEFLPDIPGWEDDCIYENCPYDWPRLGVNLVYPHSGLRKAFLHYVPNHGENIVWQLTDQTIEADMVYTLNAWGQNGGVRPTGTVEQLRMSFFYDDGAGNHFEVASDIAFLPDDYGVWHECSAVFTSNDAPASVGKKLGIAFKNMDVGCYDKGWLNLDDVQLEMSHLSAYNPRPANGATDVFVGTDITWLLDESVDYCNVYFGTNPNVTSNPKVVNGQTQGKVEIYDPPNNLADDTTYYWRVDTTVDEVESIGGVWSFTTGHESMVLENFDGYGDSAEFLTSWSGGAGTSISLDELLNIMDFTYDCVSSPWQCVAQMTFASPQDWNDNVWTALQINFRGDENNYPETMSITLSDGSNTATVTHSDPCITANCWWQVWDVELAPFSDACVDLGNITSFAIGFGDGVSPGGTGTMYFNDILLYHDRCLPEMGLAGDLNADCSVDDQDLAIFMDDWLNSDYLITASEPQSTNLRAHYEFNETTGATASDSSANNYDASIEPDTVTGIWDSNGYVGGCIVLDSDFEVVLPAGVFAGIGSEATVAFRVNGDVSDYPDPVDSVEFTAGPVPIESNAWDRLVWGIDQADSYGGCWNHYAIVKNANAGTIRLYLNGLLVARNIEAPEVMSGSLAEQSLLGIIGDYELQVKVDDLYIYNYALSQSEILYLAEGSGGELVQPLQPVLTNADLTDDGIINLADFAMIMQGWMKEQLWP